MKDVMLDDVTHDFVVVNYDLALVSEIDQIKQSIKMRLLALFSEWFLDTRVGVRYFDVICTKNPDLSLVDSLLKTAILETVGVTELVSYISELDKSNRSLSVSFKVNTVYGETTDNLEVL